MDDEELNILARRAASLMESGLVNAAIEAHEELLAHDADRPDDWYNLGWLQRRDRRFEDALDTYAESLRRGVEGPEEVHLNRAVILSDHLARADDAEAELETALALAPDYVPALLNLGNLREARGDAEGAAAAYRRALEAEPGNATALGRLASLVSAEDGMHPMEEQLRAAIAQVGEPGDQAMLGFALGHALDGAGRYSEAFAAIREANEASRASRGDVRYDRDAQEQLIDRIIAAFPEPAPRGRELAGDAPLFICGMFRSGSTLVEQILASHSRVVGCGELDLVPAIVADRFLPWPEAAAAADEAAVAAARSDYLAKAPAAPGGKLRTDKRPDNFLHIGLIKRMFPEARIVHTIRNPLDNLLSLYFLHLDPRMSYALDLEDAAHFHGQHHRLMAHWQALYAGDIFEMDYDLLVADPRGSIERLLEFCGLEWEESCLSPHATRNLVATASAWQVRQPLYTHASGRWRNYRAELEPVRKRLAAGSEVSRRA